MSIENLINARIKCRAYKDAENPDGRMTLCGEKLQYDDDGRQFFEIPGHQREYLKKLLPSYEFTESYDMTEKTIPALKNKGGRPRKVTDPDE